MAVDVSEVCAALESVAAGLEIIGVSPTGPYPLLEMSTPLGTATLRLKIIAHPEAVRSRAVRLKKTSKKLGSGISKRSKEANRSLNWKPSLKQARRSSAVAQQFLDDGEKENWGSYNDIFK